MANGHGGARKGSGRKPKVMHLAAAVVQMQDNLPADVLERVMARLPPGANSLQILQHVYSAPETPSDLKLKLAVAAMPFEVPKPDKPKEVDADLEKLKQATDERVKSRLAQLLGKAGAAGAVDRGSAAGNAPASEPVRALSQAG